MDSLARHMRGEDEREGNGGTGRKDRGRGERGEGRNGGQERKNPTRSTQQEVTYVSERR